MKRLALLTTLFAAVLLASFALPRGVFAGALCGTTPCVDSADIIDGSVKGNDIGTAAVGKSKIRPDSINSSKVIDGSLTGADIQDGSVMPADLGFAPGKYGKVAVVAISGGDYTNPVTAVNNYSAWCGTPSASNPCLLKIMPGVL